MSVLRCPDHPVETLDNRGIQQVKYALFPHRGDWREGNTMQKGYEFNYPLITVTESVHKGSLPARYSFIEVSPENVMVTAIKQSEDSENKIVLRLLETEGSDCTVQIKLSPIMMIDAVHKADLMENDLEEIPLMNNGIKVEVGKYAIESYKLIKDN